MYCKPIILGPNGKVPVYKTKQAACADVYLPEDVTKDNTTTDKGTIEHKTVRQGNIGVTTTQQMITEEIQLRKEMFYERVFSDIDRC